MSLTNDQIDARRRAGEASQGPLFHVAPAADPAPDPAQEKKEWQARAIRRELRLLLHVYFGRDGRSAKLAGKD